MRQHAGVFAANFSSNLLWQNCFAPKKSAFCAEPRRTAAGILDVCQGGATTGLRETRLLRRVFSYVRRPWAVLQRVDKPTPLSFRGAKRRGNPYLFRQEPAKSAEFVRFRNGLPRQCVPQGHLLRGAHWLAMTGFFDSRRAARIIRAALCAGAVKNP